MAITNVVVTDEACTGASNGTIEVTATCSLCSSIEYSVDGTNFQSSNVFTNLAPGSYTITTRDPNNTLCNATDNSATVGAGGGGDTEAPTITCPDPQTVDGDVNCEGVVPDLTGLATTTDNCDPSVDVTQDISQGTMLTFGVATTVTLTATDDAGLTATCTVDVTLNDIGAPTLTCPADVSVNTAIGGCNNFVLINGATAVDNCSPSVIVGLPSFDTGLFLNTF